MNNSTALICIVSQAIGMIMLAMCIREQRESIEVLQRRVTSLESGHK